MVWPIESSTPSRLLMASIKRLSIAYSLALLSTYPPSPSNLLLPVVVLHTTFLPPKRVVSGSYDCSIKVWEQENPKTITLEHLKKLLEPTPSPTKPQNNAAIPLNLPPLPLKKEKAKRMRWRPLGKKRGKKGK